MQQAINRGFDIIEFVARQLEEPTSFNDIAKHSGLNTGTCANIIKALVQRGYLEKLDDKKGYLLGKKLYHLVGNRDYKRELVSAAKPYLDALTNRFNENSLIAVLKENSRYVLYQNTSKQDIQAHSPVDKQAYDSATGRVLVAMLSDEELEKYITRYGLPSASLWKSATTKRSLRKEVEAIRSNGYSQQESERHIVGFAVPVFQDKTTVAAISIYLPTYRRANVNEMEIVASLKKAAQNIGKQLTQ